MGVFDNNPYISTKHGQSPSDADAGRRDAEAKGEWWTLRRQGEGYQLSYLTGQLQGGERILNVTLEEAEAIRRVGEKAVDEVLRAHNAG